MPEVVFRTEEISLAFGGLRALSKVSIEARRGEIVGIIGPNGAGKSTLFNVISGLYRPTGGRIFLEDDDVTDLLPYERVRLGLGRTFQNPRLYPTLTVHENLLTAMHSRTGAGLLASGMTLRRSRADERRIRERADWVMSVVDMTPYRDRLAANLSYGTLRLLELACVLALSPKVLLLDEPTAGVAEKEAEAMAPLLLRVRDLVGATIVLIEHHMPIISALSDVVYAMQLGTVVTRGSFDEVASHPQVIEAYLGAGDVDVEIAS